MQGVQLRRVKYVELGPSGRFHLGQSVHVHNLNKAQESGEVPRPNTWAQMNKQQISKQ